MTDLVLPITAKVPPENYTVKDLTAMVEMTSRWLKEKLRRLGLNPSGYVLSRGQIGNRASPYYDLATLQKLLAVPKGS